MTTEATRQSAEAELKRLGIRVICWMNGHDTGFHDHDGSSGGVAVAQGTIREERPLWGRSPRRIEPQAGESFHSPPIEGMGAYAVTPRGDVHRRSVVWDEKLEPDLV